MSRRYFSSWSPDRTLTRKTALQKILESVEKRTTLIRDDLHDDAGNHCTLGCFWADHRGAILPRELVEKIAAENDSRGTKESGARRLKRMVRWLRAQLEAESKASVPA